MPKRPTTSASTLPPRHLFPDAPADGRTGARGRADRRPRTEGLPSVPPPDLRLHAPAPPPRPVPPRPAERGRLPAEWWTAGPPCMYVPPDLRLRLCLPDQLNDVRFGFSCLIFKTYRRRTYLTQE
uniref:Uncharacterized protein n=1 Tax=Triticum urartu TaxID=4572 RepID=A0A8R7V9F2_TRIUA